MLRYVAMLYEAKTKPGLDILTSLTLPNLAQSDQTNDQQNLPLCLIRPWIPNQDMICIILFPTRLTV